MEGNLLRTKFVAFSCLHSPLTHKGYFEWLLKQIEDFRPDVIVNLGDWFEGKCAKRWPSWSDEKWSLDDELYAVARQAIDIRMAVPSARYVWLYGNHDDNLFGLAPDRIPDDIKDSVQWDRNVTTAEAFKGWEVTKKYGDRVRFRLGPITFQHGCSTQINAEKDAGYSHGTPYGLYVCGHTHRPVRVTQAEERRRYLPYWYANPGCGVEWSRLHYMDRLQMSKWGRGCIVGDCAGADQRRTAFASKQWDAELRIHSMAFDER